MCRQNELLDWARYSAATAAADGIDDRCARKRECIPNGRYDASQPPMFSLMLLPVNDFIIIITGRRCDVF